jgi:spermidine synthase
MIVSAKKLSGVADTLAIWLLVFSAGWFVMLTELVGARVLSPYFGNTIYVWGSVIGIFLLAMAVGYAIGGRSTQLFASPLVPAVLVAVAGLYVACSQMCADEVCAWLYALHLDARWGALAAAAVLYGPPMVLLGGVSPYCIHLATQTRMEAGRHAGILYALSTIGSFAGCIFTAFILIPGFPLWHITIGGGIILAAIAVLVGLTLANRRRPAMVGLALLALAVVLIAGRNSGKIWHGDKEAYEYGPTGRVLSTASPAEMKPLWDRDEALARQEANGVTDSYRKVIFEKDTAYHHVAVLQEGSQRELIFGKPGFHTAQSQINLKDLRWPSYEYTRLSFAPMLYNPAPKRALVIGIGGAVVPRILERYAPGIHVDAVDVDPTVVDVARDYFYWHPSKNVTVYVQDGRSFVNWVLVTGQPRYDIVYIDAYCDEYIPFHLTTKEFISTVKRVLNPGGVVAANIFVDNDFYGCEARTFDEVFGNASSFVGHASGNQILISQLGRTGRMTPEEAGSAIRRIPTSPEVRIDYRDIVSSLWVGQNWSTQGPILTDMWSPVESLVR